MTTASNGSFTFDTFGNAGGMTCTVAKDSKATNCVAKVGGLADYKLAAEAGGPLMYYSPSCPHCTNAAPKWAAMAAATGKAYAVNVQDANCQRAGLCDNVAAVPKLVYLNSSGESDEYAGPMTVEGLKAWALQNSGAMMLGPNVVAAYSSMGAY